jgi:hypothetical protein
MYRRKRPSRGPLVVGVVVLMVTVVSAVLWLSGPSQAPAGGPRVEDESPVAAAPPPSAGRSSAATIDRLPRTEWPLAREAQPAPVSTVARPPVQEPLSSAPPRAPGRAVSEANPVPEPAAPSPDKRRRALQRLEQGLAQLAANRPVEARRLLSAALDAAALTSDEQDRARQTLTDLNARLVFGPDIVPDDPFVTKYTVKAGDSLQAIAQRGSVDWRFIQRINRLPSERIRIDQSLKLITGVFHAVVHKPAFRMDLYLSDSAGPDRVYVRSMRTGLGEFNATPEGVFTVKPRSRLINPRWVNPRTGEVFEPDDPRNPIGEHWIGLLGASENIHGLESYGIHGTIDPDSIGQEKSMGCVRLRPEDVALVWELLAEGRSTVEVRP